MQERTQGRTHPWQAAQGPPNDAHPGPTPADTCKYGIPLHGKKAFTDVMKDVGMGRLFWAVGLDPMESQGPPFQGSRKVRFRERRGACSRAVPSQGVRAAS